jgi:hypothetical protein
VTTTKPQSLISYQLYTSHRKVDEFCELAILWIIHVWRWQKLLFFSNLLSFPPHFHLIFLSPLNLSLLCFIPRLLNKKVRLITYKFFLSLHLSVWASLLINSDRTNRFSWNSIWRSYHFLILCLQPFQNVKVPNSDADAKLTPINVWL